MPVKTAKKNRIATGIVSEFLRYNPYQIPTTPSSSPNLSDTDINLGIFTDMHWSPREERINRYYRDAGLKTSEIVQWFNDQNNFDHIMFVGDLIDNTEGEQDPWDTREEALKDLENAEEVASKLNFPRDYVLGNHDLDQLYKSEFLSNISTSNPSEYYYFDISKQSIDLRVIVLDGNWLNEDTEYGGNEGDYGPYIPSAQRTWLQDVLSTAPGKAIVFCHYGMGHDAWYNVNNYLEMQSIFENAGNVLGVYAGHHHSGGVDTINGIEYRILKASTEGPYPTNIWYTINIDSNYNITLQSYS